MSDDPPPRTHVYSDVGISSERLASVASDHPVEVETVRLSAEADRVLGPTTFDQQLRREDQDLRKQIATRIVWTLIGGNSLTLIAIAALVVLDQMNIADNLISPADRIVTNQVLMTLLGATTVQVGAIAYIIAQYLFRR